MTNIIGINQKAWSYIYDRVVGLDDWESRVAISDGYRHYSYPDFFDNIKKYASVFSALRMTGRDKARVGLIGTGAAETIFSFYGLNMTGAEVSVISSLSALKADKLINVIKDEHLTDLIITDEFIQEKTIQKIVAKKDLVGLRFILLLHLPMTGCTMPPYLSYYFEQKASMIRSTWGPLYMDFLIEMYGNHSISYCDDISSDTACIIHTSGTTSGSGSPIVMSDRALNSMCEAVDVFDRFDEIKKNPSTALLVDLSNAYGLIIQVHVPLSFGGKIATVPANALNPYFFNVIPTEKINLLFCTGAVIDMWDKIPGIENVDFSSIKAVIMGGTQITVEDKKRFAAFFDRLGVKNMPIFNGYGISELGGVCALSSSDINDDSLGQLLQGINWCLFDEDENCFLTEKDLPCSGVLYLNSECMSSLYLDGKQIVKTEKFHMKDYVCTNDLVGIDENLNLTYLGRANRFFLHGNHEKYQSGLVESEIARQNGIKSCGIVPVFDKPNHDNIPMLCIEPSVKHGNACSTVESALNSVFIENRTLSMSQLPLRVLVTDRLPRNANGKIDLYCLNQGKVDGKKYTVEQKDSRIVLEAICDETDDIISKVYKGIAKDILDE